MKFCPNCGLDLHRQERELVRGRWRMAQDRTWFDDADLDISPQQSAFLFTLAAAVGNWVSAEVMGQRISDAESSNTIASVVAFNLRQRLGRGSVPFISQKRRGYRWEDSTCTNQ